ncbi:MAG: sialidase family protein [Pseudomonadota bacterium]
MRLHGLAPAVCAAVLFSVTPLAAEPLTQRGTWVDYEVYNPSIEHVTLYDRQTIKRDPNGRFAVDSEGRLITWLDRVIEPGDPELRCIEADTPEACAQSGDRWLYFEYEKPYIYNHMSALERFQGRWFALWGANDKKVPNQRQLKPYFSAGTLPSDFETTPGFGEIEGAPQQKIVLATNDDGSFRTWSPPVGLFGAEMDGPRARQWAPDLLRVADQSRPGTEELWALWSQHPGRSTEAYLARLTQADGRWQVQSLVIENNLLADSPRGAADRYARLAPGAIQLSPAWQAITGSKSGRVLVPSAVRGLAERNKYDLMVFYSDDFGQSWRPSQRIEPPEGIKPWEPVLLADDSSQKLYLYARNNEDHGEPSSQMLVFAESLDGGKTWSTLKPLLLEVPSLRPQAFSLGNRKVLIHHDIENGFAGKAGAFRPGRTGRVTDSGPLGGFAPNDRMNMALFFSRDGRPGSWLPATAFTNNALSDPEQANQRGVSYSSFSLDEANDRLYVIHSSARSIRGEIISPLPKPGVAYLFPRTAIEIEEMKDQGGVACKTLKDVPAGKRAEARCYNNTLTAYRPEVTEGDVLSLTKQASVSIETDLLDEEELLQLRFKARLPKGKRLKRAQRMALVTVGGPNDYGLLEVGHPKHRDQIIFRRLQGKQEEITVIGPYPGGGWTEINLFMTPKGAALKLGDAPLVEAQPGRPFAAQKLFFGYGYTQGRAYREATFNPEGKLEIRVGSVESRRMAVSALPTLAEDPSSSAAN